MPKEAKYSVPVSAFGRLAVKSHNSADNSGKGMPVNTRSMQRLSSTPQGSRPGVSHGTPQYSISRSATNIISTSNDDVESSDEDTEDDDEEEEGDAGNDDDEETESEEDDSDDEDGPASQVREIFAIAEPSGLVPAELEDDEPGMNEASSGMYRRLLDVVAAEAARNERFLNDLKSVVSAPSRAWTLLMYFQLRTRLETIMSRFDQDPRKHDAINTATRLKGLIDAIDSMVEPDNWKVMDPITKQQYFGLLLDLLRGVVDRDRARDSQGSRSPYVTESRRDVDLYQQLKDTQENKDGVIRGAALLQSMFNQLSPYGLDARQIEHIGSTLRTVENRYGLSGTGVVTTSPDPTRVLVAHLRQMQFAITKQIPASSRGSRSSRSS